MNTHTTQMAARLAEIHHDELLQRSATRRSVAAAGPAANSRRDRPTAMPATRTRRRLAAATAVGLSAATAIGIAAAAAHPAPVEAPAIERSSDQPAIGGDAVPSDHIAFGRFLRAM